MLIRMTKVQKYRPPLRQKSASLADRIVENLERIATKSGKRRTEEKQGEGTGRRSRGGRAGSGRSWPLWMQIRVRNV